MVWAAVVHTVHETARLSWINTLLIVTAAAIAAIGIIEDQLLLIVGAMALSPDYFQVAEICLSVVRRDLGRLIVGVRTLAVMFGGGVVGAYLLTELLATFDVISSGSTPDRQLTLFISEPNALSLVVALLAGVDLPERRIVLDEDGNVADIRFRERLDAHRLIEEFMILANVAAAETLEAHRTPLIYRVHEEPAPERLDLLREIVEPLGMRLAKGQVLKTRHFNELLARRAARSMPRWSACRCCAPRRRPTTAPQNLGHFGLNLPRYAHFTSPIRRYADLVVHRALITALGLGRTG